MSIDARGDGLKAAWRSQPRESDPVTLAQIHEKVRVLHWQSRKTMLVSGLAIIAGIIVAVLQWQIFPMTLMRVGILLVLAGYVVALVQLYRIHVARLHPSAVTSVDCVSYLRGQLQESLRLTGGGWLRLWVPFVPGAVVVLSASVIAHPGFYLARYVPLAVVAGIWGMTMLVRMRRSIHHLRAEIAELEAISSDSTSNDLA